MKRSTSILATIPTVVLVTLGIPAGAAWANLNFPDATCEGLVFRMDRGEDRTVVTTRLNGTVVRTDVIAEFGDSLNFQIPSPDQTRTNTWSVLVDSPYSEGEVAWFGTVPACVAVTVPPVPATTTTLPPAPTTTTVPPPSSTVPPASTTVPPAAPTTTPATVIEPPRTTVPPPAPPTTPPPTWRLPDTGPTEQQEHTLLAGAGLIAAGAAALSLARVRRRSGIRW